jgi:hypothetical protein
MASSEVMCIEAHCAITGSGFYIIPGTGCRAYYHCDQGMRTDYLCPLGTTYDRNKQVRGAMPQLKTINIISTLFKIFIFTYLFNDTLRAGSRIFSSPDRPGRL